MKRIIAILLSALMLLTLAACGNTADEPDTVTPDNSNDADANASDDADLDADTEDTVAYALIRQYNALLAQDPEMNAQDIADALLTNPVITFGGITMPVEEGLLVGFDNAEITGFEEGVMFGPMISTTPFIGYIFTLKDDTNAEEFQQMLHANANLRWNICTEADQALSDMAGDTVIFVMAPESFEEE